MVRFNLKIRSSEIAKLERKKRRSSDGDEKLELITEDTTFQRMKRRLQRIQHEVDIKEYTREIYSLQTSRAVAALKTKAILRDSLRVIIDASVDEIATRSRASTIKLATLHAMLQIEDMVSHLSKYLLSKYAKRLHRQGVTTITAQKTHIDVYMREFLEFKRSLEYLIRMVDVVLEDTDQVSYGLKRVQDAIDSNSRDR